MIAKKDTSSAVSEGGATRSSDTSEGSGAWFRMHWRLITLFAIIIVAFLLRFVFAYGISAGDNYALSGGSSASNHLRIITEILAGTYDPANQIALNYPYGTESISGPLYDYVMAAFAFIVSACGVSNATAAAGTMAWSAPILGALTCIPVYLLGKKMFKGDESVGILSAMFYAVFAVLVMTSPFSNGTELPLVCFLAAWFVFFVASALAAVDASGAVGIKAVVNDRAVRTYTLFAAASLGLIVLTWTSFWAVIAVAAAILFVTLLVERIGGRDLAAVTGIADLILIVAVAVGAVYYIPLNLWDGVFVGGCVLAILTIVYSLIFLALEKKPWVLTVPLMVVIIAVVAVVIAVALPDLSHAILGGNNGYAGALMSALADQSSRTSISAMASYYGWITVWFPLIFAVGMLYKIRANARSKLYMFTMLWLFACFFVSWFNTSYAVVAGAGFAVGASALILTVVRQVGVKSYIASLKGNGFRAGAKKALNFFPLVTVLVAVFLVAVPTAVYAVDASTPTNDEHANYFGGLGYSINTSDSSLISSTWSDFSGKDKTGAMLTWYGYSDTASSVGGFSTVTSSNGGGTSAMASAYFADGSDGAIATLIIRLAESNPSEYQAIFDSFGVSDVSKYISDESEARKYMDDHKEDFTAYNTSVKAQSLPYIAGVNYLTSVLNGSKLSALYDSICAVSGKAITYIEVDSSMMPLYFNDGSYANTIAYFGDYSLDSSFGCPDAYYEVTSTTEAYVSYGYYDQYYYTYKDAMYDTFMWNALLGVTPAAGSNSSIQLLTSLANSDGSVKAQPATGIDNFTVAYWHVMYRASANDSWKDMDAYEAIALQEKDGGFINYLASVVVLQYSSAGHVEKSGQVTGTNGHAVKVAVFEKVDYAKSISYVQRSTTTTDADGKFTVSVPATGEYLVKYYAGSSTLRDGNVFATDVNTVSASIALAPIDQVGYLTDAQGKHFVESHCALTFTGSNGVAIPVDVATDGRFELTGFVPDKYSVAVYDATGATVNTVTVNLTEQVSPEILISAGACTLDVTVKDIFGNAMAGVVVVKVYNSSMAVEATISGGNGKISVAPGTYSVTLSSGYVPATSKTVTVSSDSSSSAASVELVAVPGNNMTSSPGNIVMALGYSNLFSGSACTVPVIAEGALTVYDGTGVKVSGKVVDTSSKAVVATVAFIKSDASYVFSTDADGAFDVIIPAGTYAVYATDGKGLASFTNMDVGENMTVTVDTAYAVTANVNYSTLMSPSTNGFAFVPVKFGVVTSNGSFSATVIAGSDGKAVIYVPSGANIVATVVKDVFSVYSAFTVAEDLQQSQDNITASSSLNLNIGGTDSSANHTNGIDYTVPGALIIVDTEGNNFNGVLKLEAYSSSGVSCKATIVDGVITALNKKIDGSGDAMPLFVPGRYTVTSDDDSVYITSSVIDVYPSTTKVTIESYNAFKVTVTTENSNDNVKVVALDEGLNNNKSATNDYYFEVGKKFYFVVTDVDGTKICYSSVQTSAGTFSSVLQDKVVLKGYVGSKLTGTLTLSKDDYAVNVEVKDGEYSVDLPKGTVISDMTLKAEYSDDNYKYTVDQSVATDVTVDADKILNFVVETGRADANDVIVISTGTMSAGRGTLDLTISNKNDYAVTYTVIGSDVFVLDKSYSVYIPANLTANLTIKGSYNEKVIGAGNLGATVSVTTVDGTNVATKIVPARLYDESVVGDVSMKQGTDSIDGYAYRYALVFHNAGSKQVSETISAAIAAGATGWTLKLVDAEGHFVKASGSSFDLNGLEDTVVYVMLINDSGEKAEVPSVDVTTSGCGPLTLTKATVSLSEEAGSVSGGHADNNKVSVNTAFWIFTVLTILVFLLLIWGGLKRGVFGRRN